MNGSMDSADNRKTLFEWLCLQFPESPRTRVKEWLRSGRVSIDGRIVRGPRELMSDPRSSITLGDADPRHEMPHVSVRGIEILYADAWLLIVNKAAGLLSVPSESSRVPSVLQVLRREVDASIRAVHRLDRFTSGLICFARSDAAHELLVQQVREHTLRRDYIALCEGVPSERFGIWTDYLKLDPNGSQGFSTADDPEATRAVTHFKVVSIFRYASKPCARLLLQLESGLKHQIRIQASVRGFPLIGDTPYGASLAQREASTRKPKPLLDRHALHACKLGLTHPVTGAEVVVEAPLPRELVRLVRTLARSTR
jgi:23S rRNA pseudouridine1911/1915/1917 synthase